MQQHTSAYNVLTRTLDPCGRVKGQNIFFLKCDLCFVINFTRFSKITLRLVNLPCLTLVLPGHTSDSRNSSLVVILYRGPSVPGLQIKPIPSRQSGQP